MVPVFFHPSSFIIHPFSFCILIVDPACLRAVLICAELRASWDQVEVFVAYGLLDGVGGGEDCYLQLLVPEFGLVGFDLAVELADFVIEFQALLAELEGHYGQGHGADQAD
jgi:hypothetical protein